MLCKVKNKEVIFSAINRNISIDLVKKVMDIQVP